jgi:cytochrome oxidase Cu insertion factor (SCO1/SenC/PrrC family)
MDTSRCRSPRPRARPRPDFHDEQLSLDDRVLTTVRIEAVRALGAFGDAAGDDALRALRALASERVVANELGPVLREAIETAVIAIEPRPHCHAAQEPVIPFASAWRDAAQRDAPVLAAFPELAGKPFALTFFYTRCDNDRKCAMNLSRFAQLHSAVETAGLSGKVRLIAVTYDPEYDTPLHLARFANGRELRTGDGLRLIRSTPDVLKELARTLRLAVSFADGRPNVHGVELFLLDRDGRVAREYRNVIWNERDVLADLGVLAGE